MATSPTEAPQTSRPRPWLSRNGSRSTVAASSTVTAGVLGFGNVNEERILRGVEVLAQVLSGTPA